jgi:catechol 2,3-dioxygenase-like lactoylglutathione lyase family enzyme
MIDVRRLGHVTLATPDLDRQIDYYCAIFGLKLVERTRERAVLATRLGLETIVLERGERAALLRIGFQIDPKTTLADIAGQLQARDIAHEIRQDITPGVRDAVVFDDAGGTTLEVFSAYDFATCDRSQSGIAPLKLGHVARWVADVPANAAFYTGLLNFRVSDWRTDVGAFLRCGPDHHTLNLAQGETPGLAHIAFEVKDWAELQRACDVLAANDLRLDWGPSRHNIGHNISCYHRNPDGVRVEIYTEMDQMKDEALGYFDPRPWHEDMPQRPKVWPLSTSKNYWGLWGST